jgi:hypothetical protein
VYQGLEYLQQLSAEHISNMPWNIREAYEQVVGLGKRYLLDVAHFIRTTKIKTSKVLSFNLNDVACLTKGKLSKTYEFGREFQIGRIAGNFVITYLMDTLRANDKNAIAPMLQEHKNIFNTSPTTLAADKGYYSNNNIQSISKDTAQVHLGYQWEDESEEDYRRLYSRRAGIEPIIGHIKQGGQLGRSRMKSDMATHSAGYGAMLGFNLRQLMRKL